MGICYNKEAGTEFLNAEDVSQMFVNTSLLL
jgi:hypothetical protein